jgi:hypothetical protein
LAGGKSKNPAWSGMQFFLDIDGVLLNFEKSFARWLNEGYGFRLPETYETTSWNYDDLLPREHIKEAWQRYLESDHSATMDPLVDLTRFNALAGSHDVHLVTNFPLQHADKREQNLAQHGFTYSSLNFCGLRGFGGLKPRTKSEVIAQLRRSGEHALFVDDHPDNCLDVLENCGDTEVWVMTRLFNRDFAHPDIRRAQDWECVFNRIGQLME